MLLLSSNEVARADRFHSDPLREFFIFCRSTLRQILSCYADVPAECLLFDYGPNGKPFLPCYPQLHFNTSHSRDSLALLVCGVSLYSEIGVDVEQLRPIDDMQLIAKHFFAPAERARLADLPLALRNRGFFECWTRKEAVIKATGEGVSRSLDSFEVSFGPNIEPKVLRFDQDPLSEWQMACFEPIPGYVGAIASQHPWHQLRIKTFPPFPERE